MQIDVFGTGPGLKHFPKKSKSVRVGVNDIFKYLPVDYLVLLDHPESFTPERLQIIEDSTPFVTYSDLQSWEHMPNYRRIFKGGNPGEAKTVANLMAMPFHVDSTYTATAIAYNLGASKIVLWGVDFTNHHLGQNYREQILRAYSSMFTELAALKCQLYIGYKDSLLSEVLPVHI